MMSSQRKRAEDLFQVAVDSTPAERSKYLDSECGSDAALREEVEKLIQAYELQVVDRVQQLLQIGSVVGGDFLDPVTMTDSREHSAGGEEPKLSSDRLPERMGDYAIQGEIGRGGMGHVYLAMDTKLDRQAAIKLLPDRFSNDAHRVALFKREAVTAAHLNHPNIATIYGFHELRGRHYLAMEYVEGRMLSDLFKKGESLPLLEFLDIAVQMAEGLTAAHKGNVVHRDLKPGNVMITDESLVKILDFGLAKAVEGDSPSELALTGPGEMGEGSMAFGTIGYSSPEQCNNELVDYRSDLFSFGVVLYELATGVSPFRQDDFQATYWAVLNKKPESARSTNPHLPPKVSGLIHRLLEKHPEDRFQSSEEVLRLLKRHKRWAEAKHYGRRKRQRLYLMGAALITVSALAVAWAVFGGPQASDVEERLFREGLAQVQDLMDERDLQMAGSILLAWEDKFPQDVQLLTAKGDLVTLHRIDIEQDAENAIGQAKAGNLESAIKHQNSIGNHNAELQALRAASGATISTILVEKVLNQAREFERRVDELMKGRPGELETANPAAIRAVLKKASELEKLCFDDSDIYVPAEKAAGDLRDAVVRSIEGRDFDDSTPSELEEYWQLLEQIRPRSEKLAQLRLLGFEKRMDEALGGIIEGDATATSVKDRMLDLEDKATEYGLEEELANSTVSVKLTLYYRRLEREEALSTEAQDAFKDGLTNTLAGVLKEWEASLEATGEKYNNLVAAEEWLDTWSAACLTTKESPVEARLMLAKLEDADLPGDYAGREEHLGTLRGTILRTEGSHKLTAIEDSAKRGESEEARNSLFKLGEELSPVVAEQLRKKVSDTQSLLTHFDEVEDARRLLNLRFEEFLALAETDQDAAHRAYEKLGWMSLAAEGALDEAARRATGQYRRELVLHQALSRVRLGQYQEVLEDQAELGDSVDGLLLRGQARYALADRDHALIQLALEDFLKAVDLDPSNRPALYWCGVSHIALEQSEEARIVLQNAVKVGHGVGRYKCADAYKRLAQIHRDAGRISAAIVCAHASRDGFSLTHDEVMATLGGYEVAASTDVLARTAGEASLEYAKDHLHEEQYEEAGHHLRTAITHVGGSDGVVAVLDDEFAHFCRLLRSQRVPSGLSSSSAEAKRLLTMLDTCWVDLESALGKELGFPDEDSRLRRLRARTRLRLEDHQGVIDDATKLLPAPEGYLLRAQARLFLAAGNKKAIREALGDVNLALNSRPDGCAYYLRAALTHRLLDTADPPLGELKEILGDLRIAIDKGWNSADAWLLRALICNELVAIIPSKGNKDEVASLDREAITAATLALGVDLCEEDIVIALKGARAAAESGASLFEYDAYLARAAAKSHDKDWAGCVADCSSAIEKSKGSAYALVWRGSAYVNQRHYDLARKDFNEALEVGGLSEDVANDVQIALDDLRGK